MSEVTRVLSAIEQGDPSAAAQLLPLVYDELRQLAAQRLAQEKPGQTLEATALVHEAYLRLVGNQAPSAGGEPLAPAAGERGRGEGVRWNSRGHFFGAAAEAMRRILVDSARMRNADKRGGGRVRLSLDKAVIVVSKPDENILELNDALDKLAGRDGQAAELVKLRFFAGLTAEQAADVLGVSPRTADRLWGYARSFLLKELKHAAE
jgi:DNA-directed RNA polymerase specialized sigma24 family protein